MRPAKTQLKLETETNEAAYVHCLDWFLPLYHWFSFVWIICAYVSSSLYVYVRECVYCMYLLHVYVCACVSAGVCKVLKRASDALEL